MYPLPYFFSALSQKLLPTPFSYSYTFVMYFLPRSSSTFSQYFLPGRKYWKKALEESTGRKYWKEVLEESTGRKCLSCPAVGNTESFIDSLSIFLSIKYWFVTKIPQISTTCFHNTEHHQLVVKIWVWRPYTTILQKSPILLSRIRDTLQFIFHGNPRFEITTHKSLFDRWTC